MSSSRKSTEKRKPGEFETPVGSSSSTFNYREEESGRTGPALELPPSLKNLLNCSVDLVYLLGEDASFLAVNEITSQLLGCSSEELLTMKVYDIDVTYDLPNWQRTFQRLRKVKSFRIETLHRPRYGELFPVELTLNYVMHNGREFCLGVGRDVTERKRIEEALKSSVEKYREVVEDQIEMICRFVPDGTITFANRAFCEFYSRGSLEIVGNSYLSLLAESQYPVFTASIEELLADPGRVIFDIQPHQCSKGTMWIEQTLRALVSDNGQVEKFQVVLRDITDKRKAEQALRESKEQYQLVFDRMQDGFAVFELLYEDNDRATDARFLEVNPAFEHITGVKSNDIVGKTLWEVFPTMRLKSIDFWKDLISSGKNVLIDELYMMTLDKYMRISGMSLKKGRYAVLISDITGQKRMMEKLMRTDRLSSLGEMAAGLAHEINNPLTGILGLSQLLMGKSGIPESVKEDAGAISREANRAAGILKDFLLFARGQKPDKQAADINSIIDSVLKLRRTYMKKSGIEVVTSLTNGLPELLLDVSQIQQVFLNIVLNAEYFMCEANGKGMLRISTGVAREMVRAVFSDDGPGIPEGNIARLFDPFFTTKELGKGTGLGLSISYGVIKEHNGHIYAESMPGRGARFIVELPVNGAGR
ncbi:MAG: PAS domain S-box protein [Dehalococcoidia bacterium]|nr:PAS domain S-box protein [Dehalococcoidia bacterium]